MRTRFFLLLYSETRAMKVFIIHIYEQDLQLLVVYRKTSEAQVSVWRIRLYFFSSGKNLNNRYNILVFIVFFLPQKLIILFLGTSCERAAYTFTRTPYSIYRQEIIEIEKRHLEDSVLAVILTTSHRIDFCLYRVL